MTIFIEFYEGETIGGELVLRKVAECPAREVFDLPKDKAVDFWYVQDIRNRVIKLRMEGEK